MGYLAIAQCKCGYEKYIGLGGGRSNHLQHCGFPCYCDSCEELFTGNLYDEQLSCKSCGGRHIRSYDHHHFQLHGKDAEKPCTTNWFQQLRNRLFKREPAKDDELDKHIFKWSTTARLGRDLKLTSNNYLCPSCKEYGLSFDIVTT